MSYSEASETSGQGVVERLFTPKVANDPIPAYEQMHAECPVARGAGVFGHSVWLTKYEDVMWAFKHPEVFSSEGAVQVGNEVPLIPLSVDPPDHAKYRVCSTRSSPRGR